MMSRRLASITSASALVTAPGATMSAMTSPSMTMSRGSPRAAVRECTNPPDITSMARPLWQPGFNLSLHPVHHVAGGDDRCARTDAVLGVALLHPIGRNEGDAKIAVGVGADDRLVVARHRPR